MKEFWVGLHNWYTDDGILEDSDALFVANFEDEAKRKLKGCLIQTFRNCCAFRDVSAWVDEHFKGEGRDYWSFGNETFLIKKYYA